MREGGGRASTSRSVGEAGYLVAQIGSDGSGSCPNPVALPRARLGGDAQEQHRRLSGACRLAEAEALCRGYCTRARLTDEEMEADPDFVRLRCVVGNIHGAGRWLAGLNPTEEVLRRLQHGAACDRAVHGEADRMRRLLRTAAV